MVDEVRSLMGVDAAALARYDADESATLLAVSAEADARVASPGDKLSTEGHNVTASVSRTGRPARIDDYTKATGGPHVRQAREAGIQSMVGAPVQGRERVVWGLLGVYSMHRPLPADTEARLADFAALVASAIANVQAWSELEASRVRIISAADEARRRVMRDLHDGAQQRIVALTPGPGGLRSLRLRRKLALMPSCEASRSTSRRFSWNCARSPPDCTLPPCRTAASLPR